MKPTTLRKIGYARDLFAGVGLMATALFLADLIATVIRLVLAA